MNQFLRNLTPTQQVAALFLIVFGILVMLGVILGSFVGGLFSFITPFKPGQAVAMAFIACVAGSMGHLLMKALKRDRGITAWGHRGMEVTGANGLLDRVDALCFAAPIFFHSVRWYFGV